MTENHFPSDFEQWPVKPTIIVDTREQTPLTFTRLASEIIGLPTGDYSIKGFENHFAIERKSIVRQWQNPRNGKQAKCTWAENS